MLVWTVSDFVAKKTKSLLSSLFVASIIFLSGIFPDDLLSASSLLALAGVVVGFIIVHLGTMISLEDFKKQWKTFLIGLSTVIGIGVALWVASLIFGVTIAGSAQDGYAQSRDFVIAGTGALSGGTISVVLVQEAALGVGLTSVAIFPILIASLQGLLGFPLTSIILRREAARLKDEYRAGNLAPLETQDDEGDVQTRLPDALTTTAGTLFVVGVAVLVSIGISNITDGTLNTFVDALGLMMIAIMILIFGRLATVQPADVKALAWPLFLAFAFGIVGIGLFSALVGKLLGYSVPMSVAIGLTSLYGFPGTMILSQEAARGAGESPEEIAAIENEILPKMIVTSILVGRIGG
jgi:MFS family permease